MAIRQPAGGDDVWVFAGRVADGLAGGDAARASRRSQNRRGRGRGQPARGTVSGGISLDPQRWEGDLGKRHGGGGGGERSASANGRNNRRHHGAQATGDATAAGAADGGDRQA